MKLIDEAYEKALRVLRACVRKTGFYASGLKGGYEAVWARDSMIASLGGACCNGNEFKRPFGASIDTLSRYQSALGQIPNAVGSYNIDRRSSTTYSSIDSTLWYLIGQSIYAKAYKNAGLLKKYKKNIKKAMTWLKYQDPNEDGLPVQQPTMDWQDAFPHKYGRVINTIALYYFALRQFRQNKLAVRIKRVTNGETEKYLSLYDKKRGYYLPWTWKNHDGDREQEGWFDTLGNLLAILSGLATPKITKNILRYIEKKKINKPFPCKAIYPPIKKGDKEWKSYFAKCEAEKPYHYLNAGIWPFIGGFYVMALIKAKQFSKAEKELENLAKANKLGKNMTWGFQEWLDGKNGKVAGGSSPYQAWTAGAYLLAYKSLKAKRVVIFD